jgi:hypothetical protein
LLHRKADGVHHLLAIRGAEVLVHRQADHL